MKCIGSINISHFLVTIISLGTFFFIGSIIQIEAVKKDGTLLGDYNDLKKLVGDIKNGNFNDNQISLNDFKNSVAYQDADENMQVCINLAAKIGHNLGDNEIVHCFDNTNYFKDKYPNVSVPKAKVPQPESKPGPGPEPKAKPSAAEDYNNLKELVGDIKNGNFNDNQISLNDFKNSVAYQDADENMQVCINLAAKIGHNLGDNEIVHCFDNTNYFKDKYPNVSVPKAKVPQPESKPERGVTEANITQQAPELKPEPKAKPSAAEDYNDLKKLVGDIKNGNFNDNQISLNDFKNSVAYQDADENMQVCINLAAKIGHNLGDNEIVHCFDNTNYFKDKYPNVSVPKAKVPQPESKPERSVSEANITQQAPELKPELNVPETNASLNVPETNASLNVPETNASLNVPETNASLNVPETNASLNVPETNASLNVPETNASLNVPETNASLNVPETNASLNVPETNASLTAPRDQCFPNHSSRPMLP